MAPLTWDEVGERFFETGVDRGVLYPTNNSGQYPLGYAWNGLTTVTESPSGAESNPQYADNIKYLNLVSAEELGATIEAFTYPDEFAQCDGTLLTEIGVAVGQQKRRKFGLAYRTKLGNDIAGADHGYKLHLLYGAQASPSEKAYATINDSPEAISFSWDVTTTPESFTVDGESLRTALLTIDSTKATPEGLAALEAALYGDADTEARLPGPAEVFTLINTGDSATSVTLTGSNAPTYNATTHVVTLPSVTGVTWRVNGDDVSPGAQTPLAFGEADNVEAVNQSGYVISGTSEWTFEY